MAKKIGFKGFNVEQDGKISCRGYVFDKVKENKYDGELKLCERGFHYCDNLKDVMTYYPIGKDTIYAKIEITGDTLTKPNSDKSVTNSFRILELYYYKDVNEYLETEYLKQHLGIVDKILEENPNYIICGRLGLIINGVVPMQEFLKDYDFVSNQYVYIENQNQQSETSGLLVEEFKSEEYLNFLDDEQHIRYNRKISGKEYNIDVFVNPTQAYRIVEIFGKKYKVATPVEAIKAKFKYFLRNPINNLKHIKDLHEIFGKIYENGGHFQNKLWKETKSHTEIDKAFHGKVEIEDDGFDFLNF